MYKDSDNQRDELDYYPTDIRIPQAALRKLPVRGFSTVIDAGAGSGIWGDVIKPRFLCNLIGVELREVEPNPNYTTWITGNFLTVDLPHADLVTGNPPYLYALEFVLRGLELVKRRTGVLYYLLPLNFLAGKERKELIYDVIPPQDVYVLSLRPSYSADGKTAINTQYALYKWDMGKPIKAPTLHFMHFKQDTAPRSVSLAGLALWEALCRMKSSKK